MRQSDEKHLLRLLADARDMGDARARTDLNNWLRTDAAARATMAGLLVDEQALIATLRNEQILSLIEKPKTSAPFPRAIQAAPAPAPRRWSLLAPMAAAAVLTIGFIVLVLARPGVRPTNAGMVAPATVAVLKECADAVWNGPALSSGSALVPGRVGLESGMIALEFATGARMIVEGPAELEIVSQKEAVCHRGRLRVEVPPPARGFTVRTPNASVVDLGTAFGLVVNPDRSAVVKVMQGEVELHRDSSVHPIKKDSAVSINTAGLVAMTRVPDEAFPSEENFQERLAAGDRERAARWQAAAGRLDEDPSTLLHYTFQETSAASRSARNRAAAASAESHGSLVGAEWAGGRWPGKKAIEFSGPGDRLLFKLAGTHPAATCLAWVRVDSLPNIYNILLMPDAVKPSALQWMITQAGELRLALTNESGKPGSARGWEGPVKAVAISRLDLGRWVFVAASYDARTGTVVLYRDGQQIGTGTFPGGLPVMFGSYSLGNWPGTSEPMAGAAETNNSRNFVGRIDELAILSRALSPGEVRRFYEEGKP